MRSKTHLTLSRWLIAFALIGGLAPTRSAHSQASLAQGDTQDLVITYNNKTEAFTVIRDALNRSQYYYVPKAPRLTEVKINGVNHPELTLFRYQFDDPSAPSGARDGGILQFAITLAAEPAAITALKDKLVSTPDAPADLKLTQLPIKSAEALIYTPSAGDLASNTFGAGVAPTFGTQKAPFALYLSRGGADIGAALIGSSVNSNTGIPIVIVFTYQGMTPAASMKVTANYKKTYDYYQHESAFAAKASYFGLFGASAQIRRSDIQETLRNAGALTIEKIGNDEISEDSLNAILPSVMKRINDNIFQTTSPPAAIVPASVDTPTVEGRFGGAGYNVSYKNVSQISTLDDTFTWSERKIVERKTLAGGFIGLGQYPVDIRKDAVQFVPNFDWDRAHALLPDIGMIPRLEKVTISTQLLNDTELVASKTAVWKPSTGWHAVPGGQALEPNASLDFNIAPLLGNHVPASALKFKTDTVVQQAGLQTRISDTQAAVQLGFPVASLGEGIKTVTLDPSDLLFKNVNADAKLLRVKTVVKVGARTFTETIQPRLENGAYTQPERLVWVISKTDAETVPIKVVLKYEYANGTDPLSREVTIDNLLSKEPGLDYTIRDPAAVVVP